VVEGYEVPWGTLLELWGMLETWMMNSLFWLQWKFCFCLGDEWRSVRRTLMNIHGNLSCTSVKPCFIMIQIEPNDKGNCNNPWLSRIPWCYSRDPQDVLFGPIEHRRSSVIWEIDPPFSCTFLKVTVTGFDICRQDKNFFFRSRNNSHECCCFSSRTSR